MPKTISQRVSFLERAPHRWKVILDATENLKTGDIDGKYIGELYYEKTGFRCQMFVNGISQKHGKIFERIVTENHTLYRDAVKAFCDWAQALIDGGLIV